MTVKVRQRLYLTIVVCWGFVSISSSMRSGQKTIQAWETPVGVREMLWLMSAEIDTTLPAPELVDEPPYTLGRRNTVYWDAAAVEEMASQLAMDLLFFECTAQFDMSEYWGFVQADVDSATFENLPAGITISYRLRYYARKSDGSFGRSLWSDPVRSIQDVSPPVVESFEILNLKVSMEKQWVDGRTIQIRVVAMDSDSGQVMQIGYRETTQSDEAVFKYDLERPQSRIDTIIPYTLYVEEHEPVTLSVWVVDVAGQSSDVYSETFFWWEYEEMTCFPNPFHPDKGEISTITLNLEGVTEARIFDMFGQLVRILEKQNDQDFFEWDGKNGKGEIVSKGGYFCVVQEDERLYCKIAVLR